MKFKNKKGREHVCTILKDFERELYTYDNNVIFHNIRLYLDHVLCSNQHITNVFTKLLRYDLGNENFLKKYSQGVFPNFIREYNPDFLVKHFDKIESEIEKIHKPTEAKFLNKKDFHKNLFSLSKLKLLNLTIPYRNIISLLKYGNYENLYENAEYGYYIGSLLKFSVKNFMEKYPVKKYPDLWIEPNTRVLKNRVNNFRRGVWENYQKQNMRNVNTL